MSDMRQLAWAGYDGVNSVVHLVLITILLPWAFDEFFLSESGQSITGWAFVSVSALLFVGVLSVMIARWINRPEIRFSGFVILNLLVAAVGLAIAHIIGRGDASHLSLLAGAFSLLVTFNVMLFVYDSYIIDAAQEADLEKLTELSGKGWAVGYVFSALALFVLWIIFIRNAVITHASLASMISWAVIIFASGATIILALWPKELVARSKTEHIGFGKLLFGADADLRRIRNFLFFAFLLQDGATTLAYFVTLLAKNAYGLNLSDTVELFLIVHAVGIFSTWHTGRLLRFMGLRRVLTLVVILWIASVVLASLIVEIIAHPSLISLDPKFALYGMSVLLGLLIGTTPALLRSIYASMIPQDQRTTFFGYGVVFSRAFSFVGPAIVLTVSLMTSSYTLIAMSGLVLFLPALIILWASNSLLPEAQVGDR